MKLEELITEAPLPDEWDQAMYDPKVSFSKRIAYAKDRASKLGTGSSRVAFEIPYQGRNTVLKIAKNKKGLAQNEYESEMLNDYYLHGLNLTIPIIDYDEKSHPPTWIHVEKAAKVTPSMFKKYFGVSPDELVRLSKHMSGKQRYSGDTSYWDELSENNEHVNNFINLIGNYDIQPGDFGRLANWGLYNGSIVIIDIGGSSDIIKQYYMRR